MGERFEAKFCERCEATKAHREDTGDYCPIGAAAFLFLLGDDSYPKEWRYDEAGNATCTAFEEELSEEARERRALIAAGQMDLFCEGEGKQ